MGMCYCFASASSHWRLKYDNIRLQERPQDGAGAAAIHRRRGGGPHQDAQLPALGVEPLKSVFLQVEHLNPGQPTTLLGISHKHWWPVFFTRLASSFSRGPVLYCIRVIDHDVTPYLSQIREFTRLKIKISVLRLIGSLLTLYLGIKCYSIFLINTYTLLLL